jgi:hypothetical protein
LKPKEKNTRKHWMARLDRDRPDLAAKVDAGLMTANASAQEADRKRPKRKNLPRVDTIQPSKPSNLFGRGRHAERRGKGDHLAGCIRCDTHARNRGAGIAPGRGPDVSGRDMVRRGWLSTTQACIERNFQLELSAVNTLGTAAPRFLVPSNLFASPPR